MPKICCSASLQAIGSPSAIAAPTMKPISSSISSLRHALNTGRSSFGSLIWPFGRRTGVPLTITDDARPL